MIAMSASGSDSDIAACQVDVCIAPISGHRQAVLAYPEKRPYADTTDRMTLGS
jgi:hypothetical protein